jgi:hypothetical protein
MSNKVVKREWSPLQGSLPGNPEDGKVYILPTRYPAGTDPIPVPFYVEDVRYVPKSARRNKIPVEFAHSGSDRVFLSEFSGDPSTWEIALAFVNIANDWLIAAVQLFIQTRGAQLGFTEEQVENHPLRVSVAKIESSGQVLEGIEIEGEAKDVNAALDRFLKIEEETDDV